jgi:hypothetical protein
VLASIRHEGPFTSLNARPLLNMCDALTASCHQKQGPKCCNWLHVMRCFSFLAGFPCLNT